MKFSSSVPGRPAETCSLAHACHIGSEAAMGLLRAASGNWVISSFSLNCPALERLIAVTMVGTAPKACSLASWSGSSEPTMATGG